SLDFEGATYDITPQLAALESPEAQFSVDPSQFLPAGAGLYLLRWEAEDGEACSASALVKMQGDWWREPLGISAGLTLFLAGVGLVLTAGRPGLAVLQMTVRAMLGRKPEKEEEQDGGTGEDAGRGWAGWLRPRFETSVQLTLVSTFAGFVFGGGLTLLLQQAAVQPLTVQLALQVMLPSTLIPPALEGLVLWERRLLGEGRS
ncbi:MAG: hypothetical protein ACOC5K_01185, partial [Chloroflexota bacterium]